MNTENGETRRIYGGGKKSNKTTKNNCIRKEGSPEENTRGDLHKSMCQSRFGQAISKLKNKKNIASWTICFNDDNMYHLNYLKNINYVPSKNKIFRMFEKLQYNNVKLVIIGQDPYPGKCTVTKIQYACGPAFLVPDNVFVCPPSLKNITEELKKYVGKLNNPIRTCIKSWINQGVFLTNTALTRGINNDYLDNHQQFWKGFTINFIYEVSKLDCPIVLLGSGAHSMEKYIAHRKVIKCPHPVARDNQFIGCKIFEKIDEMIPNTINWNPPPFNI